MSIRWFTRRMGVIVVAVVCASTLASAGDEIATTPSSGWTSHFALDQCTLSDTGQNRYFILMPGRRLILGGIEDGDSVRLVITVLDQTEMVDGVRTRIVEERESAAGELLEVSRNYFAFCQENGSVFYFGENVDMYENGVVVGHGGSWRAGESGFRAGLIMPALPLVGASYYQEIAPNIAMDRARVVSTDSTVQTPFGPVAQCLVTEETSPLEPNAREFKVYAPGKGLIRDGALWLVKTEEAAVAE